MRRGNNITSPVTAVPSDGCIETDVEGGQGSSIFSVRFAAFNFWNYCARNSSTFHAAVSRPINQLPARSSSGSISAALVTTSPSYLERGRRISSVAAANSGTRSAGESPSGDWPQSRGHTEASSEKEMGGRYAKEVQAAVLAVSKYSVTNHQHHLPPADGCFDTLKGAQEAAHLCPCEAPALLISEGP